MAGWIDDFVARTEAALGDRELEALYLRGVSDDQVKQYRIGYLDQLPLDLTIPADFWGIVRGGTRIEDAFVLPLTNVLGEIRGLQFRSVVRERSGYITYYASKDEPVYFGLGQAVPAIWETGRAFLVEGAFDLFPVQRVLKEVFSVLTINTSEMLHRMLKRLAKTVWLGYDNDLSGRKGASDFVESFDDLDVRLVTFPRVLLASKKHSKDPSELWEAWGDQKFREFLLNRLDPYRERTDA